MKVETGSNLNCGCLLVFQVCPKLHTYMLYTHLGKRVITSITAHTLQLLISFCSTYMLYIHPIDKCVITSINSTHFAITHFFLFDIHAIYSSYRQVCNHFH